eukprot:scaffold13680_cov189-Ochromonas_danica.AAC.1
MINGVSKHKLFATSYEELTRVDDSSSEDEPAVPKKRVSKKSVKIVEVAKEPVVKAKAPKKKMSGGKSIRDVLMTVK